MYQQIFVIGAPRSGTTFLSSLLSYTSFGAPVETHFITKYYKKLDTYGDIKDKKVFTKLLTDILHERPVQQWKLDIETSHLFDELPRNFTFSDIVNLILSKRENSGNKECWGDKTPHYLGDIQIIHELFPSAKFIYIVRDGRDVALSLLQKPWGPNNIFTCAQYWARLNQESPVIEKLRNEGQLFFVKYEDLLDHTNKRIKEIYNFLREDISEDNIETLSNSVKSKNYGKWKTEMKNKDIEIFEATARSALISFGYELINGETKDTLGYKRYVYITHEKVMRMWFLFHTNIIEGFKIKFLGKAPFGE